MPGVCPVSAPYYRMHLAGLREAFAKLQAATGNRDSLASDVSFHASCLMQSDAADVTDAERDEAKRLIDTTAGYLIWNGLDRGSIRRRELLKAHRYAWTSPVLGTIRAPI